MSTKQNNTFISGLVEGHLDVHVYQDILKTYAKETISMPSYGNISITSVDNQTISRAQFTECEISPFRKHEIDCETNEPLPFQRKASTPSYSNKLININKIKKLLIHAFSPDDKGHRPYPSAGGLYPIEPIVFLFKEAIEGDNDLSSGAYHFRPISKKLQRIKSFETEKFFNQHMHGLFNNHKRPTFGILYLAHIGKALFKYRYRGYRHALMEVGSMYQQATLVSQNMGLRTTVWSSFSDHEILSLLGLDYGTYMALTMQFFGWEEN